MSAPQIHRLRCVRCGDWHEREAGDPYLPEICPACFDKYLARDTHELHRFVERYRRNASRHPTTLALLKWWAEYAASLPNDGEASW